MHSALGIQPVEGRKLASLCEGEKG